MVGMNFESPETRKTPVAHAESVELKGLTEDHVLVLKKILFDREHRLRKHGHAAEADELHELMKELFNNGSHDDMLLVKEDVVVSALHPGMPIEAHIEGMTGDKLKRIQFELHHWMQDAENQISDVEKSVKAGTAANRASDEDAVEHLKQELHYVQQNLLSVFF